MESGLSVSVESSPRTPPTWSVSESQSPVGNGGAPLKKGIRNLDNEILRGDDGCDDGCEESISPRGVLWEPKRSVAARRLDFSSEELSPIPAVPATAGRVRGRAGRGPWRAAPRAPCGRLHFSSGRESRGCACA